MILTNSHTESDAPALQPPEERAPLAALNGAEPPRPVWFRDALAVAPEHKFVPTPRGCLELLSWGQRGKPGLVFVHGSRAHAHWWSFIAPFFAEDYRVAAFSQAGSGGSDWRRHYNFANFAEDVHAICEAAGLYDGPRRPVLIGHSNGAALSLEYAAKRAGMAQALILVDMIYAAPDSDIVASFKKRTELLRNMPREQRIKVFPTLSDALARFRMSPPQRVENLFIVDHIARHALKRTPLPDGSGEGWIWKFDPDIYDRTDFSEAFRNTRPSIDVPVAHLLGQHSFHKPEKGDLGPLPDHTVVFEIADARHHVLVDQPLALISAIRALLAVWRA